MEALSVVEPDTVLNGYRVVSALELRPSSRSGRHAIREVGGESNGDPGMSLASSSAAASGTAQTSYQGRIHGLPGRTRPAARRSLAFPRRARDAEGRARLRQRQPRLPLRAAGRAPAVRVVRKRRRPRCDARTAPERAARTCLAIVPLIAKAQAVVRVGAAAACDRLRRVTTCTTAPAIARRKDEGDCRVPH